MTKTRRWFLRAAVGAVATAFAPTPAFSVATGGLITRPVNLLYTPECRYPFVDIPCKKSNADIVRHASLSCSGLLNEQQQAAFFIKRLCAEPTILRDIRIVEMKSPPDSLNTIAFNRGVVL